MINGTLVTGSQTQYTRPQNDSQNFKALASALQSGDLAGAQKAFQTIQANAPKSASSQNNPMSQDFNALGQALQSGDLGAAQKAFASIQQDMQSKKAHHGHGLKSAPSTDSDGDGDKSIGIAGASLSISA